MRDGQSVCYIDIDFKKETNMITKDNIAEVLKHNDIEFSIYEDFLLIGDNHQTDCRIGIKNPNLVAIIEAYLGKKLEPLPEHNPFDFEKTLLDAGFQSDNYCIWSGSCFSPLIWIVKSNINLNGRHKIEPTPQNVQILIEIKNLFEKLEK